MARIATAFPLPAWLPIQDTLFREGKVRLRLRAAAHVEDLVADDADLISPPYWATLWPSALGLARFLIRRRADFGFRISDFGFGNDRSVPSPKSEIRNPKSEIPGPVLELGCGAGLAGLVLRVLGLEVLQSDLFPAALQLARWNAERNGVEGTTYVAADWRHWPLRARFPLVIGSDILYERALHEPLRDALLQSLRPDGVAYLADPGRPPALSFAAAREAEGWSLQMHELREGDQTIFIYEMRPPKSL